MWSSQARRRVDSEKSGLTESKLRKESMMKEFKGKVAVITGGGSGIGLAIAQRCVQEGVKVVLADVNMADLTEAEAQLKAAGGTVISVRTDVAKRSDVEALAEKTLEAFGAVHLIFNNAGVGGGSTPWESTWNDWEWVLGVNLWGVIHGVKIFTPIMLAQNTECHIVNTSSGVGLAGYYPMVCYSVSKHAVVALSENLYVSLAQRNSLVKTSLLCPGVVKTKIVSSFRNRPAELRDKPVPVSDEQKALWSALIAGIDETGITPEEMADQVFTAIREERFYILPPEAKPLVRLRMEAILEERNPSTHFDVPRAPEK